MKNLPVIFFISLFLSPLFIKAQDTIPQSSIHSIFDIPHKTIWQKWMWIHRSVAFMIIKDRKPYFDTTYVKTYKKSVSVTVPVSSRFLRFNLVDWSSGNTLKYSPNNSYDLGFGVSSRWATFQLLTGVRIFENYKNQKGETHYHDTQFNIYSPRVTCDIFYQNYKSFYIRNSLSYPDYTGITRYAVRSDINAVSFGVSSYYVFNSKKFSYRSAFAYTEVQKKAQVHF